MALSRRAAMHAAEIKLMDWSDAPFRTDKAGHQRAHDSNRGPTPVLDQSQTDAVRMNVMWVTAQVLGYEDPNFDPEEFAKACGVTAPSGWLYAGLRRGMDGQYQRPGTYEFDPA